MLWHPLVPFDPAAWSDWQLRGQVQRQGCQIQLVYELKQGQGSPLHWPQPSKPPCRRDGLWQGTCFELFIGEADAESYAELNVSPSGDWNWYGLRGYRQGLEPQPLTKAPLQGIIASGEPNACQWHVLLQLELPQAWEQASLRAGMTAVMARLDGSVGYWAQHHGGPEPDFHRTDTRVLVL